MVEIVEMCVDRWRVWDNGSPGVLIRRNESGSSPDPAPK